MRKISTTLASKSSINDHQNDVVDLKPPPKRSRAFIHVDGNFATHVYATVELSAATCQRLQDVLKQLAPQLRQLESTATPLDGELHNDSASTLLVHPTQHVSFSRVVPVSKSQIQPLLHALEQQLHGHTAFNLEFDKISVFVNELRSRTFVAVEASAGEPLVTPLVRAVDAVLTKHDLPTFHLHPRPHFSIAWCPGDQRAVVERALMRVQQRVWHTAPVAALQCRVGQRVYAVWPGGAA